MSNEESTAGKNSLYMAAEWTDLLIMATRYAYETHAIAMFHQTWPRNNTNPQSHCSNFSNKVTSSGIRLFHDVLR